MERITKEGAKLFGGRAIFAGAAFGLGLFLIIISGIQGWLFTDLKAIIRYLAVLFGLIISGYGIWAFEINDNNSKDPKFVDIPKWKRVLAFILIFLLAVYGIWFITQEISVDPPTSSAPPTATDTITPTITRTPSPEPTDTPTETPSPTITETPTLQPTPQPC